MANLTFSQLLATYDETQRKNRDILLARYAQVYKAIPEYQALEQNIVDLNVSKTKAMIHGFEETEINKIKEEIIRAINQRASLLHNNGFSKDYLAPIYTCKDCLDKAYVDNKKCKCLEDKIFLNETVSSTIINRIEEETFEAFCLDYYRVGSTPEEQENNVKLARLAYNTCMKFVETFDENDTNLLITGQVGIGKTFLSSCIAKALIDNNKRVLYYSAIEFFHILSKALFAENNYECDVEKREDAERILDSICKCDLLIIDDLGTETTNRFVESQIFNYLNERVNLKKSTLISTNLSLADIKEHYKDRIISRIIGNYETVILKGHDIRMIKGKNKLHK